MKALRRSAAASSMEAPARFQKGASYQSLTGQPRYGARAGYNTKARAAASMATLTVQLQGIESLIDAMIRNRKNPYNVICTRREPPRYGEKVPCLAMGCR